MVGENFETPDIVLYRPNDHLQRVYQTYPSYDTRKYPFLFRNDEDGYNFSIKVKNFNRVY